LAQPFIPLPNGIQIVIRGVCYAQTIEEVHYVVLPGAVGPSDVQGAAEDFEAWFVADVLPLLAITYNLVSVTATDWSSASGPQFIVTEPTPLPGGVNQAAVNNTLAMVISWHTALRGRSYRGRTYLAGLSLGSVGTQNTWDASAVALVDAAYTEIPGFNTTEPYELVVASFYSGVDTDGKPIPRTTGVGTPIIALNIPAQMYNQRRRRPGFGI